MNDEIERLRHSATAALLSRRDVLIVASVSCIYGLGSPEEYEGQILRTYKGTGVPFEFALQRLVDIQYQRNQVSRARGTFRVTGDTVEIFPPYEQLGYRIEWWGDTIERISSFDPTTGEIVKDDIVDNTIFPASHYVASEDRMKHAIVTIEEELHERLATFEREGKLLEAERLRMRTAYDLEMLREVGFCSGIENYSRHIDGRERRHRAVHAPRLLPRGLPDRDRRVARHRAAAARDVRGRPLAEDDAGGVRLPSPQRRGQPAAPVRRVHAARRAGRVHERHAQRLRAADEREPRRRADRAAHGAHRPRGPDPAHEGAGRRPHRRDPGADREGPADPGHHPHEEDGGGPHGLPGGDGDPRALPPLGGRHAAADRDRPGPPAGGVRRARGDQPAARGPRPAGGLARGDPRRRQGGVPPIGDLADPDDRPCGAQRRWHGADVRRRGDRLDEDRRSPRRSAAARSRWRTTWSTGSTRRRSAAR